MTTRIEVDFNSRDELGLVPAVPGDADGPLRVGDTVDAFDAEGSRCPAIVSRVSGGAISIDPVWRAFAAPGEARLVLTSPVASMWADWRNRLTVSFSERSRLAPTPAVARGVTGTVDLAQQPRQLVTA